jgi:peptidyl-prolyl cis-trans isomerase C
MTTLIGARAPSGPPPSISVNGTVIRRAAIAREAQYHPAPSASASWRKAAQALVLRELLLQEAQRQAIAATPQVDGEGRRETDEEASIRALVEREVRVPWPSPEELRRYYEANVGKFRSPDIVEARHILVAARAQEKERLAVARERAAALAAELAANPGSFADLARAHSDCQSAAEGGFLGQLTEGQTTPEFAAALAALGDGETTREPVETRYGFHIIHRHRSLPGKLLPFKAVEERIRDYLTERARRTATAQYLARLVSRADIAGIAMAGAEAHRVN